MAQFTTVFTHLDADLHGVVLLLQAGFTFLGTCLIRAKTGITVSNNNGVAYVAAPGFLAIGIHPDA